MDKRDSGKYSFRRAVSKNGCHWTVEHFISSFLSSRVAISKLHYFEECSSTLHDPIVLKTNAVCAYSKMQRRYPKSEMRKASVWMHRDEYAKVLELSNDLSMNLFMMRAVRKAIADAEEEQKREVLQGQSLTRPSQAATTSTDANLGVS